MGYLLVTVDIVNSSSWRVHSIVWEYPCRFYSFEYKRIIR